MDITARLVSSFTLNGSGGNPAGVVLSADDLTDAQKLSIAQIIGFSETAFVAKDNDADFGVSFFTTTGEVDFCGHATLAVFSTLFSEGVISAGKYTQKTKAGLLGVEVEQNGHVVMQQQSPSFLGQFEYSDIAPLMGLDAHVLAQTGLPIVVVSTGLPDVIVPVPTGILDTINTNDDKLSAFSAQQEVMGVHAFEFCEKGSEFTASCRNFAPLLGIAEESATGSASGALASYLAKYTSNDLASQYVFEQGRAMNCASKISAAIEYDETNTPRVKVGGFAKQIGKQTITI